MTDPNDFEPDEDTLIDDQDHDFEPDEDFDEWDQHDADREYERAHSPMGW